MEYPRVIRCSAVFGSVIVETVVFGILSIVLPALLVVSETNRGDEYIVAGWGLWVISVIATPVLALSLRCKIVVDRDEVTFIQRGRDRAFRWDEIWAFEVVNELRMSQGHVIGVDGQRFGPNALRSRRFGPKAPESLRYTCDLLNYELHLRRGAAAAG